jgi:hypothetical protein
MSANFRTLMAYLLLAFTTCGFPNLHAQAAASAMNEGVAEKMAEKAFLDETKHGIAKYSIQPLKHTSERWRFVVKGSGEFARPGYHWLVEIDKITGKSTVTSGE